MEVVIPTEIGLPTRCTRDFTPTENNPSLANGLDLAEGCRDLARIKIAKYQQELERGYNRIGRPRSFKIIDWVLRKVCGGKKKKLQPNWEGLYRVTKLAGTNSRAWKCCPMGMEHQQSAQVIHLGLSNSS